jgi:hypothetical protein
MDCECVQHARESKMYSGWCARLGKRERGDSGRAVVLCCVGVGRDVDVMDWFCLRQM